jgi:hypothetical protein
MKRENETNEMKRNRRKMAPFRLFRFISFVSFSLFILIGCQSKNHQAEGKRQNEIWDFSTFLPQQGSAGYNNEVVVAFRRCCFDNQSCITASHSHGFANYRKGESNFPQE